MAEGSKYFASCPLPPPRAYLQLLNCSGAAVTHLASRCTRKTPKVYSQKPNHTPTKKNTHTNTFEQSQSKAPSFQRQNNRFDATTLPHWLLWKRAFGAHEEQAAHLVLASVRGGDNVHMAFALSTGCRISYREPRSVEMMCTSVCTSPLLTGVL